LAVSPCIAGQEALQANHSPENLHGAPSPAASLIAVVDKKPIAKIDDGSLLADVGRKAIAQVK
jgi:hypothetical protein